MTSNAPPRIPGRPRRLAGLLLGGLLACQPGLSQTAPAGAAAENASIAPAAVTAPALPAPSALLQPGRVRLQVYASSKKGLPGRYVYSPLVRWVSYLAVGPDGSLYFDAGPGGSGYPLVRVTPTGQVTALAYPALFDPRHGMHYDFGPLAVTPQGRVYVLYRGLCEVQGPQQVRCPPLRDAQGRVLSDSAYPNLQLLAAGPDGRIYVSDVTSIGWLGADGILHPLVSGKPVDPQGPWRGSRIEPALGAVVDMTVGGDGTLYVAGNARLGQVDIVKVSSAGEVKKLITWPGGFKNIAHLIAGPKDYLYVSGAVNAHTEGGIYRLNRKHQIELLIKGNYIDPAMDAKGNLYATEYSQKVIYKLTSLAR